MEEMAGVREITEQTTQPESEVEKAKRVIEEDRLLRLNEFRRRWIENSKELGIDSDLRLFLIDTRNG
jgi:hypothetical protein